MTACTHMCISTPIPWFVLEQYQVGDLNENAQAETRRHLESCPACAEVFSFIANDEIALPPLPITQISNHKTEKHPRRFTWRHGIGLLATAASLLLMLSLFNTSLEESDIPPNRIITKGGELSLTAVRLRGNVVTEHPAHFRDGDRFRLLLTSPFKDSTPAKVVIFQAGEVFFPYAENFTVNTGNLQSIDGAFSLSGDSDATVCVLVGSSLPSRLHLAELTPFNLPEESVCITLKAE